MKKTLAVFCALVLLLIPVFSMSACSSSKPVIGIIQFGSHASLNNCYDGIMKGLRDGGIDPDAYRIEYLNSNFDPSVSQSQANTLVNRKAKVIIAIATPSTVAAAGAADGEDIPVVFCAVTDSTVMENYKNITGSSDIPNFDRQLETVTATMGKSDLKIGVLYSTDESSSPVQVANLKKAAEKYEGMEILDSAVADITTIDTKVNDFLDQGADCFVNLLDNTIVGKLETNILPLTNAKKVPVFGSEIEQVKIGCAACASVEYLDVGAAAGKAAARILGGEAASSIPVATISDPKEYYNSRVIAAFGLQTPNGTDVKG